jgi:hypothetical protein
LNISMKDGPPKEIKPGTFSFYKGCHTLGVTKLITVNVLKIL